MNFLNKMKTIIKKPTKKIEENLFDFTNASGNYVDLFPQINPTILESLFKTSRKEVYLRLTEKEFNEFITLVSHLSPFKDFAYNFYTNLHNFLDYYNFNIKLPSLYNLSLLLSNFTFNAEIDDKKVKSIRSLYCLGSLKDYAFQVKKESFHKASITYISGIKLYYNNSAHDNALDYLNDDLILSNLKKLVDLIYEPFYLKVSDVSKKDRFFKITFNFTNKENDYELKGAYLLMLFSFFRSLLIISSGLFELWVQDLLDVLNSEEYKKLGIKNKRLFVFYALNYKLISYLNTYNFQSSLKQTVERRPLNVSALLNKHPSGLDLEKIKAKFLEYIRDDKIKKSKLYAEVKISKLEFPFKNYKEMINMGSNKNITTYWENISGKVKTIELDAKDHDLGYKDYLKVLITHLK